MFFFYFQWKLNIMRRPSKLWQSEENFRHQKIIKKNSSQSNLMIRLLTLLATITSGYPKGPPRRSPVNLIKVRHVGYQFYSDFSKKNESMVNTPTILNQTPMGFSHRGTGGLQWTWWNLGMPSKSHRWIANEFYLFSRS